jgi:ATP synthase protein I
MISALWGVVAVVLPNAVFAHKAFRYGGASKADTIVRQFYLGQALKMGLSIVVLALAFAWGQAQPMPLFVALGLGMLTQRLALLWMA